MRKLGTYFENFAFKAFDFSGRATPLEYWCVMPLIWLLILGTLPGDLREFWSFLLKREVPPLNPLYYDSILVFVLTFIPRFSLTMRRLHDSGKGGKWALLPFSTVWTSLILIVGIVAMLLSIPGNDGVASLQVVAIMMAMFLGSVDNLWNVAFAAAAILNQTGWDPIIAMFADATNSAQTAAGNAAVNINRGLQNPTASGSRMMLVTVTIIAAPIVTAFLHLYFMLLPSNPGENRFGHGEAEPITGLRKGPKSNDPMAGYAHLFEKTPEEVARLKRKQKEEIRSLYQTRVLGK